METPSMIGKYEVISKLATGGFGVIYKGWDPFIKRPVAIKMCGTPDVEVRQRFQQEAQFVGNLVHRNITLVFDYGVEGEVPYIVQEFLTGYDLDELLKAGVLDDEAAIISILLQVCDGLEFAHNRGIIHRDMKPSNIRVLEDGTVKLMDFGIAKSLEGGAARLTQTGIALGTAGYLAPEQIQGGVVDARTDVFSLGIVAYELVTKVRPFEGNTLSNVLYKILNEQPPPAVEIQPRCTPAMDEIISRSLAKDPDLRFQSAQELADALRRVPLTDRSQAISSKDRTSAVLRGALTRLDQEEYSGATDPQPAPKESLRSTPQETVLHHAPELEEDDEGRRPKVLLIFLVMLLLVVGGGGIIYFSKPVQQWLFPEGAPWIPTATPTPTVTPTPTPEPTPTPTVAPMPAATPTPSGPVQVRLVVDPPAVLSIDGTQHGTDPVAGAITVMLDPGLHTFTLSVADFPDKTFTRRVAYGTNLIALSVDVGLLTITLDPTAPTGGVAYLDGTRIGSIPLIRRKVEAGEHELVIRWPDHGEPYRERITIPRLPAAALVRVVAPPG